jgi:hypothetical protein
MIETEYKYPMLVCVVYLFSTMKDIIIRYHSFFFEYK